MRKSCNTCAFYIKSRRYCIYLGKEVADPLNPPCQGDNLNRASSTASVRTASQPRGYVGSGQAVTQAIAPQPLPTPVQPVLPQQRVIPQLAPPSSMTQPVPQFPSYAPPVESVNLDEYAPTGIPELDRLLGGGFLRGKTYLVAGETGCGKTIFSIQFLLYGALHGEPGVYIAIDEPTRHLLKGLKRFGWDVTGLIKQGKLLFLDMRTHFSKIYMKDERAKIEPKYVIESILNAAKKIRAKRLVIDPIAPLIYGGKREDVLYVREFLREMVFAIERVGTLTTIMTSEIPTGSKQLSRFGVEEFLATGIIVLGIEEIRGRLERVMYIRKARWAPVKPSKYVFEIVQGQGIVIKGPLSQFLS